MPQDLPAVVLCGAPLRSGEGFCSQPAGFQTDHHGSGACWLHGGLPGSYGGRYDSVLRLEIAELIHGFAQDPEPLNILPELFIVRALLVDFINRYEENRNLQLAWYDTWMHQPWKPGDLLMLREALQELETRLRETGEWEDDASMAAERLRDAMTMLEAMEVCYTGRPREILDIADAYRMAAEATKIVERVEKIRNRGAVPRTDFVRVMTELGRTVEAALSPSKIRTILLQAGVNLDGVDETQITEVADQLRNTLSDLWMTIRVT